MALKTYVQYQEDIVNINTLEEAIECIKKLETENEQLKEQIEAYKKKNTGGRKKHDAAWIASYNDFVDKLESGMTIMEIVALGDISRRTAYRYKAYYNDLEKSGINDKK